MENPSTIPSPKQEATKEKVKSLTVRYQLASRIDGTAKPYSKIASPTMVRVINSKRKSTRGHTCVETMIGSCLLVTFGGLLFVNVDLDNNGGVDMGGILSTTNVSQERMLQSVSSFSSTSDCCSDAHRDSAGFFTDISNADWKRMKDIYQSKQNQSEGSCYREGSTRLLEQSLRTRIYVCHATTIGNCFRRWGQVGV